ncbi:unnamed protein product [Arctogadus glacialis]
MHHASSTHYFIGVIASESEPLRSRPPQRAQRAGTGRQGALTPVSEKRVRAARAVSTGSLGLSRRMAVTLM